VTYYDCDDEMKEQANRTGRAAEAVRDEMTTKDEPRTSENRQRTSNDPRRGVLGLQFDRMLSNLASSHLRNRTQASCF